MQDRPDKIAILSALARFLQKEVHPQIADKALGFRVLIAAHLCGVVAAEAASEEEDDEAQLGRLVALLPELRDRTAPLGAAERQAAMRRLQKELSRRLCAGEVSAAELPVLRAHIVQTLREKLRVVSPRFDLSPEIE